MIRSNLMRATAVACALFGAVPFAAAQAPGPETVVATVNGKPVTLAEIERFKATIPQVAQYPTEAIFDILVERVISTRLLTDAGYAKNLQNSATVLEQMQIIEGQLVARAEVDQLVSTGVTEDKVQAAYLDFLKENPGTDEVKASHILVESKEKADAVIADLKGGADFAELAKERSIGPSAPNGGDLGYFTPGQMVPEFDAAAFAMEKGAISEEPVKTQFGWHVIKVFDRKAGTPPTLSEVRNQIEEQVGAELVNEHVQTLRGAANVETFNIDGTPKAAEQPKAAQ
jgi:peptidyl-prolyl cis-trans isomerase C